MLKHLRLRLMREMPWKTANDLAEEIFSSLSDEETPQDIPEGIRLTARDGILPIEIVDYGDNDEVPLMRFTRGDENFDFSFTGGGFTFPRPADEPASTGGASGGNVFPGQVVASLGSNLYTMAVYLSGRTRASTNVTVTQLEGDAAFPHEVGRWTLVCKEPDGNYCMWIPVWGTEI